ncbi:MAG TPA: glycosyltransferase [Polyangiaceae bacterium]|nr:glycosyltransferase [Polyangiaceae bacterium]
MTDSHRALHIAFVCDTVAGRLGGGVVAARHVIAGLRARHRVTVFASDATDPGDVRLSGFQLPLKAMREMQFTMARPDRALLEQRFAEVDVVHVQFPFWLGIVAVDAARRTGRPVVAAFHVQPENALANVGVRSRWLSRLVYKHWVSRFFGRADAVVVPTPFAERKLREHGLVRPVHVVSNGVPPDLRVPEAPQREPGHAGAFLVLAVGRLASEKRQDVILEAVRRCRHRDRIRLVLAGAGPLEEELRAKAEELPHPPEIGFLPRARLARLLATADLFVHASEVELEGIAVLEAMSAGLPVLVAQSPESAASALAVSDDFRFPAGDAAALAERIDALVERPSLLRDAAHRRLGASAPSSFDAGVERLVEVYRSVISPPGGPS